MNSKRNKFNEDVCTLDFVRLNFGFNVAVVNIVVITTIFLIGVVVFVVDICKL